MNIHGTFFQANRTLFFFPGGDHFVACFCRLGDSACVVSDIPVYWSLFTLIASWYRAWRYLNNHFLMGVPFYYQNILRAEVIGTP